VRPETALGRLVLDELPAQEGQPQGDQRHRVVLAHQHAQPVVQRVAPDAVRERLLGPARVGLRVVLERSQQLGVSELGAHVAGKQDAERCAVEAQVLLGHALQVGGRGATDATHVLGLELQAGRQRFVVAELARLALHGLLLADLVGHEVHARALELGLGGSKGAHALDLAADRGQRGLQVFGLERGVHEEQPRVERRVGAGGHCVHELLAILHVAVQARALAAAQHRREQVEVGGVGLVEARDRERQTEQGLLEAPAQHFDARAFGLTLGRARMRQLGARLRVAEGLLDLGQHRVRIDIADHHEGHVVRHVPAPVEVEHLLAREAAHRRLGADHRQPVGMLAVGQREHALREHPVRRVLAASDLLDDHLALAQELVGIEGRETHGVGQHVDPGRGIAAGHGDVVDGHVERGEGVDVPARRLDRARDLADRAALGAFEEHVLEDVGHAGLVGPLVRAAHPHPHVQGHDG
jgi:hypothetical protein